MSNPSQSTADNADFPYALTVKVTANNPLEPVDGAPVTFTATSSGASATLSANSVKISGGSASVTAVANSTSGSYTVTAFVGDASTPVDFSLTNTNGPLPAIITTNKTLATDAGGNWTSPEGSPISLTGDSFLQWSTIDSLSVTFTWNVTKNGAAYQTGTGQNFAFTPDDNGTYVVTLDVTATDGTGSVSQTIDVTNVPPTAYLRTPPGLVALSAGALDPSFGNAGEVPLVSIGFVPNALVQQPDGKLVAVGSVSAGNENEFAVARFLSDGTPDPSFGQNGIAVPNLGSNIGNPTSVLIQSDGKILVAGSNFLIRLNSDGTPDTTFGPNQTGLVVTQIVGRTVTVALQGTNILVAGGGNLNSSDVYSFAVSRYTAAGTLDTTFGPDGTGTAQFMPNPTQGVWESTGVTSMIVQGGHIYLAGGMMVYDDAGYVLDFFSPVLRLNANGQVDTSFGGAAVGDLSDYGDQSDAEADFASLTTPGWAFGTGTDPLDTGTSLGPVSMFMQADGEVLVSAPSARGLSRLAADGSSSEYVMNGLEISVAGVQPDGKLLVVNGDTVTRLNPDLTPDTSFGPNGDGQVNVNDASNSTSPGSAGYLTGSQENLNDAWKSTGVGSVLIQSDGQLVVAGYTTTFIPADLGTDEYVRAFLARLAGQSTPGQVIHEGDTVTLTGTASDPGAADVPTLAYAWSVTKDGAAYQTATGTTYQFNPSDSGTYVVTLTVTDRGGGSSSTSDTFLVQDAPPTSVQIVNPNITSSGQVSFSANVTGPSTGDQAAGYSYSINWGDGTAATNVAATANNGNGSLVLPSHTYAAAGIYTITLTATEDGGQSKSTTALVVYSTAANDSVNFTGGSSAGQMAVTTTDEGSFTTTSAPDQVLAADSGGSDTYTVNFGSTLTTPLTLAGDGATSGASVDMLIVNGDGSSTNVINKTTGQITWGSPVTETVYRSGIANTTINANGTQTNYVNDPGGSTTINGGPGANFITVTATSGSGVVINGGPTSNTYTVDLGSLAGVVTIQNSNTASRTANNLIVNGATGNNTISVAGNQVTEGTQTITDTAPLANLTVQGGSGSNQMTVSSLTVPVTNVTLAGGSGTNTYTVNTGSTASIVAGSGDNILNVNGGTVASISAPSGVTAPIVFADNYTVLDNGKLSVAASAGVLTNDLSTNGKSLTAVLATGPAHGSVTFNTDGSFVYTPTANFVGADTFTYQAKGSDGSLSSLATVTIQVSYKFGGFLPPLSNSLVFAVNRTIPIKFSLSDANGKAITSLSAVTSLQIQALDANGNPVGNPFNPASTNNQGLQYSGGQYVFNWQTKGLAAGSYQIVLKLADGTTQTKTIQLTSNGSGSNAQATDGSDASGGSAAGQLLGGNVNLYVDNSNGDLTSDDLARIQDAVNSVDATIAPYGVAINEVTDPTQADVTLNMGTTSAVGGYAQGILGCYNTTGAITLIQGWNWYAGSDPTQIGASQYDFQTTVTHELGHALGLGESSVATSAMFGTLAPATVIRSLTTADLNIPYDEGSSDPQRAALPPASTSAGAAAGNSVANNGGALSGMNPLFAELAGLVSFARNAYQSELSTLSALWQQADAWALQHLDALWSMEAGAMGMSQDTLMRNLFFAS